MSKINGNIIQNNLRADVLDKASKILDNKSSIDFGSKINDAIKKIKELNTDQKDSFLDIFIKSLEISERGILR